MRHTHTGHALPSLALLFAVFTLALHPGTAPGGDDTGKRDQAFQDATALETRSPFLRRFLVLGPVARGPARGARALASMARGLPRRLPSACPGNTGIDSDTWQVILAERDTIDLDRLLDPKGAVAYLARPLFASEPTSGQLLLGSDGPIKVWLNGDLIFSEFRYRRHKRDRVAVPISLDPGCNDLVLKTARGERWRVSARLANADGYFLKGVTPAPLPTPPAIAPLPPLVVAPGTTLTVPLHVLPEAARGTGQGREDRLRADPVSPPHSHPSEPAPAAPGVDIRLEVSGLPRFAALSTVESPALTLSPGKRHAGRYGGGALVARRGATMSRVPLPIVVASPEDLIVTPGFDAIPGCAYPLEMAVIDPLGRRLDLSPVANWHLVAGTGGLVSSGGMFRATHPGTVVVEGTYAGLKARISIDVVTGTPAVPYQRRIAHIPTLVAIYRPSDCATCTGQAMTAATEGRLFLYRNTNGGIDLALDFEVADGGLPRKRGSYFRGISADMKRRGWHRRRPGIVVGLGESEGPCYGSGHVRGAAAIHCSVLKPTFFIHEIQHALDRVITEESDLPDMVYGHGYTDPSAFGMPDFPIVAGRGADWEAAVLRAFDGYDRLAPPWNQVITFADSDGDGLADDDARLPTDERRLGSSAFSPDTDRDGLDDFREFQAGIYHGTDPTTPDSDNDGIADGDDAWPLYAMPGNGSIPYLPRTPAIDGKLDNTWPLLVAGFDTAGQCLYQTKGCNAQGRTRLYAGWNEQGLHVAVVTDSPIKSLVINLDGSGSDGPWIGGDFYVFRVRRGTGTLQRSDSPFPDEMRNEVDVPGGNVAFGRARGRGYILEVTIPADPGPGAGWDCRYLDVNCNQKLRLDPGRIIGLAFRITTRDAAVTPFEKERFVRFRLAEPLGREQRP